MQNYDAKYSGLGQGTLCIQQQCIEIFLEEDRIPVICLTKVLFQQICTIGKGVVKILDGKVKVVTWQIALCT